MIKQKFNFMVAPPLKPNHEHALQFTLNTEYIKSITKIMYKLGWKSLILRQL